VDLNKFKVLNDTQGHEMGDLLLQEVGQRLHASIRASDTVARLGGDEFVIMLCDLPGNMDEAGKLTKKIAEKMLRRLAEPYVLGSYVHRCSASLGVTLFGNAQVEVGELLKQADIAMYQIKTQQGAGSASSNPICRRSSARGHSWRRICATASRTTSLCCITSRSSWPTAASTASKPWCAGSIPNRAWCRQGSSLPWPKTAS
jgi:diguanylate cyclase (GGDEF)-like protein